MLQCKPALFCQTTCHFCTRPHHPPRSTSPPEVIVAKRQQLAAIGPSGWAKRLLYRAASLPLWAGVAAGLAARAVKE